MTHRRSPWGFWVYLSAASCAYIKDEQPVRRLSSDERTSLPEIARAATSLNSAELAKRARPSETTPVSNGGKTFEETLARIAKVDATDAAEAAKSSAASEQPRPDTGCHQLVARAAGAEAREHAAGKRSSSDVVKKQLRAAVLCLKKNPRAVNSADELGGTPLHVAANFGGTRMVAALLELGADPQARDNGGNDPADHARDRGFPEVVKLLTGIEEQTNWLWGRPLTERPQVSDAGSVLVRTWAGEVVRICTVDGKPPRTDHKNMRLVVRMTWGSKYQPCKSEVLIFEPHQLKDISARSLAMYECDDEPEPSPPRLCNQ